MIAASKTESPLVRPRNRAIKRRWPAVRGFITLEVLASLALTGILLGVATKLVLTYNRANDHYLARQRAQLAAESYVEYVRAGLAPPQDTDCVRYEATQSPGAGDWKGLTRISVTAFVKTRHGPAPRAARYTAVTYLVEVRR